MTKQTEAPISGLISQDSEENEEWTSKSQLKRESHALQNLGKKLSTLNEEQLASLPLNETLRDAIKLAQRLVNKRSALKRHYQYIGKLLRSIDADPIVEAVEKIEQQHTNSVRTFKNLEQWREKILETGDTAIHDYCLQHANCDRQKLRQITRNYQQAIDEQKKTRFARQLFQELKNNQ